MDNIWYNDFKVLFNQNALSIIPINTMTVNEQYNAAMRFSLYFSILVYILSKGVNKKIFIVPILTTLFTIISSKSEKYLKNKEKYKNDVDLYDDDEDDDDGDSHNNGTFCTKPTKDNPFMNVMISDYTTNPERKGACNYNNNISKKIKDIYFEKTYRDVNNIFDTNNSFRQYYTMPNTTIPNDQIEFAKRLYGIEGKTCKEGNGKKCKYYADIL